MLYLELCPCVWVFVLVCRLSSSMFVFLVFRLMISRDLPESPEISGDLQDLQWRSTAKKNISGILDTYLCRRYSCDTKFCRQQVFRRNYTKYQAKIAQARFLLVSSAVPSKMWREKVPNPIRCTPLNGSPRQYGLLRVYWRGTPTDP
jgi:hypothetical protein